MANEANSSGDRQTRTHGASREGAGQSRAARRGSANIAALSRCSDTQLISLIAARDIDAFAAFFDRHASRVLALGLRTVRTVADAEDVVQEVFWQVWRTASKYEPARAEPTAWLMAIAGSRAVDLLRRRGGACQSCAGAGIENTPGQDEPLMLRMELQLALGRLPPEQARVVELAFLHGWTHSEIARREDIPLGTVKTRIALGMRRLRSLLTDWQEKGTP